VEEADVLTDAAAILLAAKLKTPLQIGQHLVRAFEAAHEVGGPVAKEPNLHFGSDLPQSPGMDMSVTRYMPNQLSFGQSVSRRRLSGDRGKTNGGKRAGP